MKGLVCWLLLCCLSSRAADFLSGPSAWAPVQTNAIAAWNAGERLFRPGVKVDRAKREVRVLAEAVGHREGVTAEFFLVGPLSDRAYESIAVSVAKPSDIVAALESLGVPRGSCAGSAPFRFWPRGERFTLSVRLLDQGEKEFSPSMLLRDANQASPMIGAGGLVFTGGHWEGSNCVTDAKMPSSVISLYNDSETILDVPFRFSQSEVYGRLSVAKKIETGTLLEMVLRPSLLPDGQLRVLRTRVRVEKRKGVFWASITCLDGTPGLTAPLSDGIAWLRARFDAGREPFVTVEMAETLTVADAAAAARAFAMLDGRGIKLDERAPGALYPLAFLPQEKWRERKDRLPQPYELHVTPSSEGGLTKKVVFIEEDWNVEGLDPKLIPHEYPIEKWDEFLPLVKRLGGKDQRVNLLFVYAPSTLLLSEVMPGVRAVSSTLYLVYLFQN